MRATPQPDHPALIADIVDRDRWMMGVLEDPGLNFTARAVGCHLGLYLDLERGFCNPSISTLAQGASTTDRTVEKAIQRLEDRGWLTRRPGGGRTTSTYWLVIRPRAHLGQTAQSVPSTGGTVH